MKRVALFLVVALNFYSCKTNDHEFDASGTFEAEETIISAEASGVIRQFDITEGMELQKGVTIGFIDSTQLILKRNQLNSQITAILSKNPNSSVQIAALNQQEKQARHELARIENLVKADAATTKQLDDARSQLSIIESQKAALQSSLSITSSGLHAETNPIKVQIDQLDDQIAKSRIVNPVNGTVLTQYARVNEMASAGKSLYKIADLTSLVLRAYVTGDQLPAIKINQQVKIMVDAGKDDYKEYDGMIEWISAKSEFTPKTIQTKEERANLVYAIKIKVPNDGFLKIGMYGEVKF